MLLELTEEIRYRNENGGDNLLRYMNKMIQSGWLLSGQLKLVKGLWKGNEWLVMTVLIKFE